MESQIIVGCGAELRGFVGQEGGDWRHERSDDSVVEAIDPAVDADFLTALPSVFENRAAGDVAGLGDHIELAKSVHGGIGWEIGEFGVVGAVEGADAGEPVIDHAVADVFDGGFHAAAAIMAADDDVADFQNIHGILHDGKEVEIGFHDDVGDVAMDENLAGGEACDLIGGHAAVRATDPKVLRALLVGEFAEKIRVVGMDIGGPLAVALEEVIQVVGCHV